MIEVGRVIREYCMIERVFIYKYVSDDRKQLFVLWGYKTY